MARILAVAALALGSVVHAAVAHIDGVPPGSYIAASDEEVAALIAEAEARGEIVVCVAADTDSGCRKP